MSTILIAESGATKCSWALVSEKKQKKTETPGLSLYHTSAANIIGILRSGVLNKMKNIAVDEIYFYGTGMADDKNKKQMKKILSEVFNAKEIAVNTDLAASAHATCGNEKGVVSILGTGSGAAYYNGKRIAKEQNGIGYILGDEGSGAYLGRKVIQHFLYNTFDDELRHLFLAKYNADRDLILNNVYRQPLAAKYMADFARFLSENRGHYMVENIIEDGLNDFITMHIFKFQESWSHPLHFTGGVAFAFKDVLKELCCNYELELGKILRYPMDGLIDFYKNK